MVERRLDPRTAASPFADGQGVGELNAKGFIDTDVGRIPKEVRLLRSAVTDKEEARLLEVYDLTVHEVTRAPRLVLPPVFARRISVRDFRFSTDEMKWLHIGYVWEGQHLPVPDHPIIRSNLTVAIADYPKLLEVLHARPMTPRSKVLPLTILAAVLLAPAVFLLVRRKPWPGWQERGRIGTTTKG